MAGKANSPAGLLHVPGSINSRPSLSYTGQDPFSRLYQPIYAGESALRYQDDLHMMEDDPNHKSFLDEFVESAQGGHSSRSYVSLVIDADQLFFRPELLQSGSHGARLALQLIQENVSRDLGEHMPSERIRINCFANIAGLTGFIYGTQLATRQQLHEFWDAFATASPFNVFANGGQAFQAADSKVKAYLVDHVFDPACVRVYLGGLGDYGYRSELHSLRRHGRLSRISLLNLPSYTHVSRYYEEYRNRRVDWGDQVFVVSQDLVKKGDLPPKLVRPAR